ncbi:hypothetical protein ACVR0Q_04455 [Streptococcus canis]|uniref:hypothetical protein n=1 Tax=Streptococcus canis TaxID=1329 RepID=UPI002F964122
MKNSYFREKGLPIIQVIISVLMLILLGVITYMATGAFLTMLDPRIGSVLIRIKFLFDSQSLVRILTGSLFIVILSSVTYFFGLVCDWFVNIIDNPKSPLIQAYFSVARFINRWYLVMTISIWSLVSLSDDAFNYFTILISLVALLHEISSKSKSRFKIISHHFLKNKHYLDEI